MITDAPSLTGPRVFPHVQRRRAGDASSGQIAGTLATRLGRRLPIEVILRASSSIGEHCEAVVTGRHDGLQLDPGVLDAAAGRVAATWTPRPSQTTSAGAVTAAALSMALAWVSGWSLHAAARGRRAAAHGHMTAVLAQPVLCGVSHLVVGDAHRSESRKGSVFEVRAAVRDGRGAVMATAATTWFMT